jgi:DNA-binding NarL/FixJ family response regulator
MIGPNIKVWVFSQQPMFQQGVKQSLNSCNMEVAGEARVTDKLSQTIGVMPPDIALLDIDGAIDSGFNLASRVKQVAPGTAVIILSSNTNDDQLFRAIKAQAVAYLGKDISGNKLCEIVKSVAKGERPISESINNRPGVAAQILSQFNELSQHQAVKELISPLTSREIEIINYMAQGYANKQIAAKLSISEQTIKNHVTSILGKLDANARTEAVVKAIQKGLISIEQ